MNNSRRALLHWLALAPTSILFTQTSLIAATDSSATPAIQSNLDIQNPAAVYGESVSYSIYRKNKKIGKHLLRFTKQGEKILVEVESTIVVTLLKVPVYRFNYRSTETWVKGQLQAVKAFTNDNGDKHQVSALRSGEHMQLTDKNGSKSPSTVGHTSNHWNAEILKATTLFNTLTGKTNKIVVENLGKEDLNISKEVVVATHYRLAEDLKTDVWYDNKNRWVQLRFKGSDGSVIEYRCEGFKL